jgi:hypothetical protein
MKIFRLSWWVLPMVSVGTAVIAAVLGRIVLLRLWCAATALKVGRGDHRW